MSDYPTAGGRVFSFHGEIFEQVVTVCTKIFVSATAITEKRNGRKDWGQVFSAETHQVESPQYPNFTRR